MIKRLVVKGLHGKFDFDLPFNEDLNILTGKNGSGKTTILKLLWYLISGNLHRIMPEMRFDTIKIETSNFSLKMKVNSQPGGFKDFHWDWQIGKESNTLELNFSISGNGHEHEFDEPNRKIREVSGASVLFPTFRRIEGGFSIPSVPKQTVIGNSLPNAISDLSTIISTANHRFVMSISTHDIVELLGLVYSDMFAHTIVLDTELSTSITKRIEHYSTAREKKEIENLKHADLTLKEIQKEINHVSKERENILRPFTVLSELVDKILHYSGIRFTENIALGDATNAISSEQLSAGEKQMLSFFCYNPFMKNGIIFIDEPELSLHVDWQRVLFPTLLKQGTDNQFIVATHSPFIYSKYPDKELILDPDRGGE